MKNIVFAGALALAVSGCATVTRGTTDQIQVFSEPSGAKATTSLAHSCVTPCTIQVSRKDEFTVVYELDGYQRQEVQVKTQIAGSGAAGFAGNLILGGVVGMGVDAATGSTLEHVPNPVRATLVSLKKETSVSKRRNASPRRPPPPLPQEAPEPTPEG